MKTFSINLLRLTLTLILVSFLFSITSCNNDDDEPNEDNDGITAKDIETMIEAHIINPSKAASDYHKYSSDRAERFNATLREIYEDPNFTDTRAVWFDVKSIKAYIKYLEQESGGFDGLQFYFTVNSDGGNEKNHQTLMIAPTRKINGIQSGFTVVDGEIRYLNELLDTQKIPVKTVLNDNGFIFNDGSDSPPNGNNKKIQ